MIMGYVSPREKRERFQKAMDGNGKNNYMAPVIANLRFINIIEDLSSICAIININIYEGFQSITNDTFWYECYPSDSYDCCYI